MSTKISQLPTNLSEDAKNALREKLIRDLGFEMVDKKDVKDSSPDPLSKPVLVRAPAQARVGLKPTRVTIPYSMAFSSANVTGIINGAQVVSPDANVAEWNAFAALYDEYQVHGGKFIYTPFHFSPTASAGLSSDAMCCIGYDPTDANVTANLRELTELAQHKLTCPSQVVGASTATAKFAHVPLSGKPHEFVFKISPAKALALSSTGSMTYAPGAWKSILPAGSNIGEGTLKAYSLTDYTTSVVCITGIVYLDVSFRSRK